MTSMPMGMMNSSPTPQSPVPLPKSKKTREEVLKLRESDEWRSFASWVFAEKDKAKNARASIERQWRMNLHMYSGRQNIALSADGKIFTPKAPRWRTRSIVNRIRPTIRTELARVTSNRPSASVVPASSEDRDLFAAQAAEQVWQSEYDDKRLKNVFRRSMWWMTITGNGFVKNWWDETKQSTYTLAGNQDMLAMGDTCHAHLTPFHLFVPNLREEEIEEQPWVINVFAKPTEWAAKVYGEQYKSEVTSSDSIVSDDDLNLTSGNTQPDSVLVTEIWLKPGAHRMFPNGGYACFIGRKIVELFDEGMLYSHGQYPFIHFTHIPTGTFYADSVINDLILPQKEYNRTRSQIIEYKNRLAKPALLAAEGSVDPAKITTEPGQIIMYRPGLPAPTPMQLPNIPPFVQQELDIIIRDMEDISAQHEASRGQTPGSVTAATAISYLQERDDALLTHTYDSIESGYEKWARQTLSHVVEFWQYDRIVRSTGIDGSFDALLLKGSKISGNTDVRVEGGSSLPISKAARQAFIMDMMKMGFIDPNRGLELMEIGGIQRLYEEIKVDERQAQRENLRMQNLDPMEIERFKMEQQQEFMRQMQVNELMQDALNSYGEEAMMGGDPSLGGDPEMSSMMPNIGAVGGNPNQFVDQNTGLMAPPPQNMVPVNTWDNHALHIEIHNRFRKSQAFENLSDAHKEQFEAHVKAHASALNSAAMGAMAQMPFMEGVDGMTPPEMAGPTGEQGANQFGPPGTGMEAMGMEQ